MQDKDSNGNDTAVANRTISQTPLVEGEVTAYTFDYAGRQISRTLPLGQSESAQYDALGRLTLSTSFEGVVTPRLPHRPPTP